jgi:hypothetical protein
MIERLFRLSTSHWSMVKRAGFDRIQASPGIFVILWALQGAAFNGFYRNPMDMAKNPFA